MTAVLITLATVVALGLIWVPSEMDRRWGK
jgi:hypothetical protein